jgi:hypothetical protein
MRYHAMVFAERAGVPLVPLVYAEKTVRWLEERSLAPVPAWTPEIVAALRDALARDERTAEVAIRVRATTPAAPMADPAPATRLEPVTS